MSKRPSIPSRVKRKVRQRCGFGCVICGLPIYEYDHMPGYANVKRHEESELTLLCPNHHDQKTKGLLTEEFIEEANRTPFNHKNGATSPFEFRFAGHSPEIVMGQQIFTCNDRRRPTVMIPLMVNRHVPLGFTIDTCGLMLNLDARDSQNRPIMQIRDSELVLSTSVLDARFEGRELSIRDSSDCLALRVKFDPPERIAIEHYQVGVVGIDLAVTPSGLRIYGERIPTLNIAGSGTVCANVGVLVGEAPHGLSVGIKLGGAS